MGIRQRGRIYFGKPDKSQYIEGDPDGSVRIVADGVELFEADADGKITALPRTIQRLVPVCGNAKVGATAGWVITGGTNKASATLPASQTGSTLVIPIDGLQVGDILTSVAVVGQIESAGNAVTMTLDVRKLTAAAADLTDASLGTDDLGTGPTSDTILSASNLAVTGLTETLAADETVYALLTATTLGSTDIDVMGLVVTFTRP